MCENRSAARGLLHHGDILGESFKGISVRAANWQVVKRNTNRGKCTFLGIYVVVAITIAELVVVNGSSLRISWKPYSGLAVGTKANDRLKFDYTDN